MTSVRAPISAQAAPQTSYDERGAHLEVSSRLGLEPGVVAYDEDALPSATWSPVAMVGTGARTRHPLFGLAPSRVCRPVCGCWHQYAGLAWCECYSRFSQYAGRRLV